MQESNPLRCYPLTAFETACHHWPIYQSPAAGFPGLVVTCAAGQRRDEGSNPGRCHPGYRLATGPITALAPLQFPTMLYPAGS